MSEKELRAAKTPTAALRQPSPRVFRWATARDRANDLSAPPIGWREYLFGKQGSGFIISFIVHATLLAILAIPISQGLTRQDEISPLIEVVDAGGDGDSLGEIIEAPLLLTQKALGSDQFEAPTFTAAIPEFSMAANGALSDSAGTPGSEDGNSSADIAGAVGGYLLREPGNAVKAGRFTAFSRPIIEIGVGDKKREEFGEPGEAPLEGQAYFIVIHIKIDPRRKTYLIGDLIGSVVGTDGYTQKVPEGLYVLDDQGKPQEVKRSKPIKVTDGVVQLLMRVKGAYSGVRDNIYLKSKMLREEQNLQLIFQARRADKPE